MQVASQSPRRTLLETFQRWESLRTARPYAIGTLGWASTFLYRDSVLCYTSGGSLRVLDVRDSSGKERVISSQAFLHQLSPGHIRQRSLVDIEVCLSVLNYAEGIVVVLCEIHAPPTSSSYLFAIDIRTSEQRRASAPIPDQAPRPRFLLFVELNSTAKLFVRHTASHLFYGTLSALGPNRHHEWLIQGYDLTTSPVATPVTQKPIQLRKFYGSEIGLTCDFVIYNSHFCAVSNQSSYETEEIDWTSYYHCIQFPVFDPKPDIKPRLIWRRQHREGPINDSWTDLSLQVDIQTNDMLIVEGRREWLKGGSDCLRTYYTTVFQFLSLEDVALQVGIGAIQDAASDADTTEQEPWRSTHPPDSQLALTMDASNRSRWEEAHPRIDRHVHADAGEDEFIRSKTKYNFYHTSSNCFVDLVTQSVPVAGSARPRERIMLRTAGRFPVSPLVEDLDPGPWPCQQGRRANVPLKLKDKVLDHRKDELIDRSEEQYSQSEVYLWPSAEDAAAEEKIFDILCPGGRVGELTAMSDDRGIVYTAGPRRENGDRAVVFISFDPGWGFDGMEILKHRPAGQKCHQSSSARDPHPGGVDRRGICEEPRQDIPVRPKRELPDWSSDPICPYSLALASPAPAAKKLKSNPSPSADRPLPNEGDDRKNGSSWPSPSSSPSPPPFPPPHPSPKPRLLWREDAMYRSINRGIWLR